MGKLILEHSRGSRRFQKMLCVWDYETSHTGQPTEDHLSNAGLLLSGR